MANRVKTSKKQESTAGRFFKYIVWAVGAFVALFIVFSAGAWIYISINYPPSKLKAIATDKLSETLKRKVTIGDIRFNVFSGFAVTDLHIGNRVGWANQDFVAAKDISVSYHLLPLLWGKISLGEIKLNGPQILVERRASNEFNFSDMAASTAAAAMAPEEPSSFSLISSAEAATAPPAGVAAAAISGTTALLSIDGLNISHGKLAYLDETTKTVQQSDLTDLNLKISNISVVGSKSSFTLTTPFDYNKTHYDLSMSGSYRYFLSGQSIKEFSVNGTLNGLGFGFSGDALNMMDNFSPNMDGNASLEMLKISGLVPVSLEAMPKGLTLSGPAKVTFHLSGSLKTGLELKGTADASDLTFQYQDLCVKVAKAPCKLDFDSIRKTDSWDIPSFHAVFKNWALDGSFHYREGVSFSAEVYSQDLPLNGLNGVVPRLKNALFDGTVAVNLSWSQLLNKPTSFLPNGGQVVLKNISVSLPNEPYVQSLNSIIDFGPSTIKTQNAIFNAFDGFGTVSLAITVGKVLSYAFSLDIKDVNTGKAINSSVDAYITKDPQNYKDKLDGKMNLAFKGTAHGTAGAEMLSSLSGAGNYSISNATVKGYAVISYLNNFLKDKGNTIAIDSITGTLNPKNKVLIFTAKGDGKMGQIRANGALNMETWVCAPEIKIQSDIHKEFLDLDAVKTQLPDNIKDKFDPKLLVDSNGNVDLDFHITGDPSKPDLKWLDISRLGNVFLNNYVNQASSNGQNILQGLFGH